jgi:DNA-binding transcriptional LysR family regulator
MEYKKLPDINGWAALRAVVDQGGVMAAAKVLNVGQPAVTKRLRALEQSYGMPLVKRDGRSLTLTTVGKLVYGLAVEVLDKQFALEESLQLLDRGHSQLRLEMSLSIGEYFLSGWLVDFARMHPQYRVRSRLGYGREIEARLSRGIVDAAILEAPPNRPDILVQPWIDDELWLVCGPNHPLASHNMISVDRLKSGRFVLREARSSLRENLDEALRQIGIDQLHCELEAGSNKAIMEILSKDDLLSFLPRFFVTGPVTGGKIHRIKVKGFRILRTLWIARRKDRLSHPPTEAFVEMLTHQRY